MQDTGCQMDARITIRVPQDLYERAKAKAKREDITLSQVLRRCLREWAAEDPPEEPEQEG
jgi:predicted HicB family RNase H-like nuclease